MINLLPPEDRKQLAAARTNALLSRYTLLTGVVILALFIEMTGMYLYLAADKAGQEETIRTNSAKTGTPEFQKVKKESDTFQQNLNTTRYILGQQVNYTALTTEIAQLLPTGVTLDRLTLDPTAFGTPQTMTVKAGTSQAVVDLKNNLLSRESTYFKKRIFTDASIQSISTQNAGVTGTLSVTFNKEVLK